ncbi:MAG: hypothetical protein PHT40_01950 [Patescibacteria group bacterium]|nr:hypothetical protein [Patescibacteria group bacterium]
MPRGRTIFTIIAIIILLGVITLAIFLIMKQKVDENINTVILPPDTGQVTTNTPEVPAVTEPAPEPESVPLIAPTEEEKTRGFLIKTAAAFAERFGSYSSQSNFENLLDLKMLMTERMQNWVDSLVVAGSAPATVYYGLTTKALNTEIKNLDATSAEVLVSTQRQESVGSEVNSKVYYQDILISFVKEAGLWQVDEARWQ